MTELRISRPALFFFLLTLVVLQPGCRSEKSNKPPGYTKPAEKVVVNKYAPNPNESAYETVLRELKNNPDNLKEIYHLADLYYRDGKYEKAIENYRKVLSREPDRGFVYLRLATSLNRIQRYEEALEAYRKAIPLLAKPEVAYNNMGITYGKLGRYQEEIDAMRKAIEFRPRYASARYNLGVTLLKVGDIEGARQQYEAINEFDLTMAAALLKEINKAERSRGSTTENQ